MKEVTSFVGCADHYRICGEILQVTPSMANLLRMTMRYRVGRKWTMELLRVKRRFIGATVLKLPRGRIGLKCTSDSSRHGLD